MIPRDRGIAAAGGTIAVGLAGTILDPNGVVGIALFSAAATAVLYLMARAVAGTRLRRASPARVPMLVRRCTVALIAVGAGALLSATNLFDANGQAAADRVLNDVTFLGGFALVAALALVALGTAARWILTAGGTARGVASGRRGSAWPTRTTSSSPTR
jgi:hypothetical protein